MLVNLHVKNLALIEEENIDLMKDLIYFLVKPVQVNLLFLVLLMLH